LTDVPCRKVRGLRQEYERLQRGYDQTRAALKEKERQRNKEALLSTYTPSPSAGGGGRSSQQELTEALLKERENRVLGYGASQLDSFISIGNLTLERMRTQGRTMKSAQRRLLDAANSLGISQSIIRVIQRKSSQDRAVFYGGIVVTFLVIYLCWKYFAS
jgi:Golgi SNAP receptor complex protein 2